MLKKTLVVSAAVVFLLGLLFGRSHVVTTLGMVRQQVKDSVPVQFEIKRARQMIKDLRPEIEKNLRMIAQEEVEVARIQQRVSNAETQLAKDRADILRLQADLSSGSEVFVYASHQYSAKEVKADLAARFEQYKTQDSTTVALKKILQARQQSLTAAREKLEGMMDAKQQLEVQVENLEARLAMVEVAKTTSDFKFDDSQLSRTRELIDEIGMRIEVDEKLVNVDVHYFDRIPLNEEEVERDVIEEISQYFGKLQSGAESYAETNDVIEYDAEL